MHNLTSQHCKIALGRQSGSGQVVKPCTDHGTGGSRNVTHAQSMQNTTGVGAILPYYFGVTGATRDTYSECVGHKKKKKNGRRSARLALDKEKHDEFCNRFYCHSSVSNGRTDCGNNFKSFLHMRFLRVML